MDEDEARRRATRGRALYDKKAGVPHPIDVHVGARLKLRRVVLGLSQEKLGRGLGLTFQQIQKYERGANRIGASRLYEFSRLLGVSVSFFFDEMAEPLRDLGQPYPQAALADDWSPGGGDPAFKRESLELLRAYYGIESAQVRHAVYETVKALCKADAHD